jgi:putative membrane protein
MAWVRTGLSMIGFGFTIYKFLMSAQTAGLRENAPRDVGLFLIGVGTISMLFGAVEYWATSRTLHREYGVRFKRYPLLIGLLIAALGAVLFVRIVLGSV